MQLLFAFLLLTQPLCLEAFDLATNATTDGLALLSFKSLMRGDPSGALDSWGQQSLLLCQWYGVTCGKHGLRRGRVTALDLDGLGLVGTISPAIANLTFLGRLHLPENQLHDSIPTELGNLLNLKHVNLSSNFLIGEIPPSLSHCVYLYNISMGHNNLQGGIPPSLAVLSELRELELMDNMLDGPIPREFGSLHNLEVLNLRHNKLKGSIPSEIGNLRNLHVLDLSNNNLTGEIPLEIGSLVNLVRLHLGSNHLTGSIPTSFGNLHKLQAMYLWGNQLMGPIPSSLGNLSTLLFLNLAKNNLIGSIVSLQGLSSLSSLILQENYLEGCVPSWLGNLSSLTYISFGQNNLTGSIPESLGNLNMLTGLVLADNNLTGSIPPTLGNLHALSELYLDRNQLTGPIPSSMFNLSSLRVFNVQSNELNGSFPPDLGNKFPKLAIFDVDYNLFHGAIPPGLCNASMLEVFQTTESFFSGTIPRCFGNRLKSLSILALSKNQLEASQDTDWDFLYSLTNCSRLRVLDLSFNKFGGVLPNSVANLSRNLEAFDIQYNMISGKIPEGIGNLVNLSMLYMAANLLEGPIPASIGKLQRLNLIDLGSNNLSGQIPPTLGNLTMLNRLYLRQNALSGTIPSSLRSCPLELFDVQNNKLTGPIPKELFLISTLSDFMYFQNNLLTGTLPSEIGNLKNLVDLDFSENRLSGEITASIGECQSLQYLNMRGNFFGGTIPSSMGQLKGLLVLDLSQNNLFGKIPEFLGSMRGLASLNLSFNHFNGEVPKDGIFLNASAVSIAGNDDLCGGIPQLNWPPCPNHHTKKWSWKVVMAISIGGAVLCLILLFALFAFWHWRSNKLRRGNQDSKLVNDKHQRISYAELARATDGFSSTNLIGVGSFGSVYKGIMTNHGLHDVVAVKVLNLQQRGASQSFVAECETLRCVRHRNLVKILTVCSSIDFTGVDFKALVFEFLPNGSLDQWLHRHVGEEGERRVLNLFQRLCIAIDVASALDYLHHYKPMSIVHCDLKPSNILLDNDMVAHVGDFGLARFLHQDGSNCSEKSTGWAAMRGTIGYAAPEYGMGNEVSIHGDIYSYGVLLLEMFTAKRPTDKEFGEDLSLVRYVEMGLPDQAANVIDQHLLSAIEEDGRRAQNSPSMREIAIVCITSILQIGILCAKDSPADRMQIGDVLKELQGIREKFIERPGNHQSV